MVNISGEGWQGVFDQNTNQARGKANGYSWFLKLKSAYWSFEIAEDQAIDAEQLPLVGFGCGGWLAEIPRESGVTLDVVTTILQGQFTAFADGKLKYYPSVNCSCSD